MSRTESPDLTGEQIESLKRLMNYMTPDLEVCGTCRYASGPATALRCEKPNNIGLPAIPVEEQAVCDHYQSTVG